MTHQQKFNSEAERGISGGESWQGRSCATEHRLAGVLAATGSAEKREPGRPHVSEQETL